MRATSELSNVRTSFVAEPRAKTVGFAARKSVSELTPRTEARDRRSESEDIDGRLYIPLHNRAEPSGRIRNATRLSLGSDDDLHRGTSETWTAGDLTPTTSKTLASYMEMEEDTAQQDETKIQAIMTALPRYALDAGKTCACLCFSGPEAHQRRVEQGLAEAAAKFPQFADEIQRTRIIHVDVDMAIFVDDQERRMYTSIRGTSPDVCRDICNDCFITFGRPPPRLHKCCEVYRRVRREHAEYKSYGCGHSLGGAIMHELAYRMEKDPALAFVRVDVFNAGGSPLKRRYTALSRTEFNAHRVQGDLVSAWYEPPTLSRKIQHVQRTSIGAHGLGHFLPRQRKTIVNTATETTGKVRSWFASSFFSCWRLQLCKCLGDRPR